MAVKKHNPLVAQVKFLSTGQDKDEPIHSYVARLRGIANQCNFTIEGNFMETADFLHHCLSCSSAPGR